MLLGAGVVVDDYSQNSLKLFFLFPAGKDEVELVNDVGDIGTVFFVEDGVGRGLLKLIDGGASTTLLDGFGLFDVIDLSLEELSLFLHFIKFLFKGSFLYFYVLVLGIF